jgi:DNA modification methylase
MHLAEAPAPASARVVEIVRPGLAASAPPANRLLWPPDNPVVDASAPPANRLLWTPDNLVALQTLLDERDPATGEPRYRGKVALVYIDPPFMVNSDFRADPAARVGEGEPGGGGILAYSDTWKEGLDGFLSMLKPRLELLRELLAPTGNLFVHLDWHVAHYAKVLLDELFGYDCFRAEIVWRYRRWPAKTRNLQRMHDTILFYRRSPAVEPTFNVLHEDLAASTLRTFGTKRQVADFSSGHRKPGRLDEETPGSPLSDVWEIGVIAPISAERLGYPTQKPLALLERIVRIATNPGDTVLDCFMGSGTTLEAAERLGRRWIGIDSSRYAIHLAHKRLLQLHGRPRPPAEAQITHVACARCKNIERKEKPQPSPGPFDVLPFTLEEVAAPSTASTAGEVRAPLAVQIRAEVAGRRVRVTLDRCDVDAGALRESGQPLRDAGSWKKLVDLWAVDWDHGAAVFEAGWQSFRGRKTKGEAAAPVLIAEHTYPEAGRYRVAARVTDVFGNDGIAAVDVTVE